MFTLLNILYNRLLPLIQNHPDFVWPPPIRSDLEQHDRSLRCDYHRDHGHETNRCWNMKFLVEKLIRACHLRGYIRDSPRLIEPAPITERITAHSEVLSEPLPTINYILGGPAEDQYQFSHQRKKLLRAATVRARVKTISTPDNSEAI